MEYLAASHARLSSLFPFPASLAVVLGLSVPACILLISLTV